jgi:hypothetical protein
MARTKKADKTAENKKKRKEFLDLLSEPFDEDEPGHASYIKRDGRGRPSVMTKQVLQKLREAFSIGAPDREACIYANVSESTLYNYCKKNNDFLEEKEELKEVPILQARSNIALALKSKSVGDSWQYLIRKRKAEFADMKVEAQIEAPLTIDDLEALDRGDVNVIKENKKEIKNNKKK